ncbi:MAG: hypothetical protein ACPIOQ_68235, partial [Promethearchaeia archaeon]
PWAGVAQRACLFGSGDAGTAGDQVCLGDMCWTTDAKSALSNILRAYLSPKYGIKSVHERRLLQGVFKSLLSQEWATVAGDLAMPLRNAAGCKGETKRGQTTRMSRTAARKILREACGSTTWQHGR